jgi:hypothetical protein
MKGTLMLPIHPEAKLSAFYKDPANVLHKLDAWLAIDPEGVTEEDVQRLSHESYIHLSCEDKPFIEPVLVLIRGGKA